MEGASEGSARGQRLDNLLQRTERHVIWLKGRREEEKILQTVVLVLKLRGTTGRFQAWE